MNPLRLVFSPLAQGDLKKIFQYGQTNWGKTEATSYLEKLKGRLWYLTEYPEIGKKREELLPLMRSLVVEQHVVFYQIRKEQIDIIRVLHGRQDPQTHIITPENNG